MINPASELAAAYWENGFAADCPILDFHAHMGPFYGGYIPNRDAEGMLESMRRCHTALTCFCSHESLFAPQVGIPGDLAVAKRYPDRFKAYHIVSSRHLRPEEDLERVEANADCYVGFKFLCDYYGVPLSDARHRPYWEYADRKGLLVLCHTWGGSAMDGIGEAEAVLSRYRNLTLIAGHSFFGEWEEAVRLAGRYPNLCLELTAVLHRRGPLDFFVDRLGSHRILFGVDLPWFSYYHGIGAVLSAGISDEDRRNIFHRNGVKLLGRFAWFEPFWEKARRSGHFDPV